MYNIKNYIVKYHKCGVTPENRNNIATFGHDIHHCLTGHRSSFHGKRSVTLIRPVFD